MYVCIKVKNILNFVVFSSKNLGSTKIKKRIWNEFLFYRLLPNLEVRAVGVKGGKKIVTAVEETIAIHRPNT